MVQILRIHLVGQLRQLPKNKTKQNKKDLLIIHFNTLKCTNVWVYLSIIETMWVYYLCFAQVVLLLQFSNIVLIRSEKLTGWKLHKFEQLLFLSWIQQYLNYYCFTLIWLGLWAYYTKNLQNDLCVFGEWLTLTRMDCRALSMTLSLASVL